MAESPHMDAEAFRRFEHEGWQAAAAAYHDAFASLTGQSIRPLLDAVGAEEGVRLLDVATGPGYVASAAAERKALAVGVDFAAAMVAQARRLHPGIEFREGDAEALPFPGGRFDAVVMNFGLLHLARPERALTEAHRVLRPGGRLAFTVWAKPEKAVAFGIVLEALQAHGNPNAPLPPGPPFFRFSDHEESRRVLHEAGFAAPTVVEVPLVWRLDSPEALFNMMRQATVRTAGLLRGQSKAALDAVARAIGKAAVAYAKENRIDLPMPAVLASAVKP